MKSQIYHRLIVDIADVQGKYFSTFVLNAAKMPTSQLALLEVV
ncbi:MAG: hypothetical protein ACYTXC_29775 [Nostoc sp.]